MFFKALNPYVKKYLQFIKDEISQWVEWEPEANFFKAPYVQNQSLVDLLDIRYKELKRESHMIGMLMMMSLQF